MQILNKMLKNSKFLSDFFPGPLLGVRKSTQRILASFKKPKFSKKKKLPKTTHKTAKLISFYIFWQFKVNALQQTIP